ncbi:hypothetical protein F4813DRAFT_394831 [Daldinia decipiens]|uniref:uncharacterized protein n=1 Tax=Daldinia decipiens TaxID=326647 RepID=UPI0020C29504|nr:uncharacterized protein F4813DRAFT_394831 [Daldinia decipiens]KAI1662653.1 hypothetical protein F4813DRAFT_394831 [Daldinia decipiens]
MADPLALTSPGSSDTPMEGHAQPATMAALNFGHHQDLTSLGHMDRNLLFPTGRHQADSYGPGRIGNRLALWYHRNDGPWTPPGLTSPQGDIRNSSVLGNLRNSHLMFYSQYRESPSECDTVPPGGIPSDSGYGGSYVAKHSVANGSVCDEPIDRNPEGELSFSSYNQDMMSKLNPEIPWSQSQLPSTSPQPAIARQINPEGSKICETCKKELKTKSEFKKHKQRHDKPFKCTVKGCTRSEGFSTPNDLDRHKRSLHPDEHADGDRYRCQVGPCFNKNKIWPRADNFRAHMKRVHQKDSIKDEDLDQYKYRPEAPSKDDSDVARNSTVSEFDRLNIFPDGGGNHASDNWKLPRSPIIDLSADTNPVEGPSQIQIEEPTLVIEPSESHLDASNSTTAQEVHLESEDTPFSHQTEAHKPPSPRSSPSLGDSEPTNTGQLKEDGPGFHAEFLGPELANDTGSASHSQTDRLDESRDRPSGLSLRNLESNIQPERLIKDSERVHLSPEPEDHELLTPDLNNPEFVSKLLEQLQNKGMLKKLGYKKEDPQEADMTKLESTNDIISQQAHACSQCSKLFGRRCELKKHEKRHLKPYGCTFPGCSKKFGSKNDWKRHESSQHLMLEHWICDEKQADKSSESCGRNFPRRELFKQHLSAQHRIIEQELLDHKLDTCRVGRNHETRFWCGFCREIIEITKEGIEAWAERFNHIDDHFQGRNNRAKRDIGDWKGDYPPRSGSTKPRANDSVDTGITSSGPVSSPNSPGIHNSNGVEKPHARVANQKRKRGLELEMVASKRAEILEEITTVICVGDVPSSL